MTVEQRLKRLETQTFRLRWVVIVLVAISAGAVIFAVTQREDIPAVIRARSFEVIGENGKVAAKMGHAGNNGGVWIFNAEGYSAVFLTTDDFGAGSVATFNGKEVFSANMSPAISANPYFAFHTKATESGTFEFTWTDDKGKKVTASRKISVT